MTVNMGLTDFVPMISQWKLQEIDDIYDSFDDWDFHTYRCVMKDGKEIFATGIADEDYEGNCSKYIDLEGDYKFEDIVFWCETPTAPNINKIDIYGKAKIIECIKSTMEQFLIESKNGIYSGVYVNELKKRIEELEEENAELNEQNRSYEQLIDTGSVTLMKDRLKNYKQLTEAKEIIEGLLNIPDLIEDRTSEHTELIGKAEQFLK